MKQFLKGKYWLFIVLATIIFFWLRLPQVLTNQIPFVFDMGRDHIWVRNMVELKRPTLIGPWGSLAGIYFGPAWYYLLAIPYILTSGDPRGSVIWVMLINLVVLLFGAKFIKKEISKKAAILFAFLFALSPQNINITTSPFHANILPLTMMAMLWSMYQFLKGKKHLLWIGALATSLNFHFEPATGVFTTLTLILFLIWQRKKINLKALSLSGFSFFLPFIPQLIFELRHNFIQSRSLLLYFQGQNESLKGKLPFFFRLGERIRKFTELFSEAVIPYVPLIIAGLILAAIIVFLQKAKKTKQETRLFSLLLLSLLVPLLGFMFLFPPELKRWYLYGFSINYFILVALFLNKLVANRLTIYSLFLIPYFFWLGQLHNHLLGIKQSTLTGPDILSSQLKVVDRVYQLAGGKPFNVYTYVPPIYDYQYQYLYWWKSRQEEKPLPVEYSYLPNETSYHPQKDQFSSLLQIEPEITFLVIEPENDLNRIQGWLGHFADFQSVEEEVLPSGLTIQTRLPPSSEVQ